MGIDAPGASADEVSAAVAGCSEVLSANECTSNIEAEMPTWRAEITFLDEARLFATVRLTRYEDGAEAEVLVRDIRFAETDPPEHRFRAVGLIVAAHLVARGDRPTPPAPPPPPAPEPEGEPPPPPPPPQLSWYRVGFDVALLAGGGLAEQQVPFGIAVRPYYRPTPLPLDLILGFRWARSDDAVRSDWMGLSAGARVRLVPPDWPLGLELRAEFLAEQVNLLATADGETERASTWRFGGRFGADVSVPFASRFAFVLGGDVGVLDPDVVVSVAGQPAGRTSGPELQGLVGVRVDLF